MVWRDLRNSPYVESRERRRRWAGLLLVLLAAIALAACTQSVPSPTPLPPPTAMSTPIPTATPAPTTGLTITPQDGVLPQPDSDRLANLSRLLSLIPADFGTAVFVDVRALEAAPVLESAFDLGGIGIPGIVPPTAISLMDGVGIVPGTAGAGTLTVLDGFTEIDSLLRLTGALGFTLGEPEAELYRDHRVWNLEALGLIMAVGEADVSTVVLSSGIFSENRSLLGLVKGSLDSFDGLAPSWQDDPINARLLNRLPSGFVTTLLAQCDDLAQLSAAIDLPGCAGAAVSAEALGADRLVIYGIIAFADAALASTGMELAMQRIEAEGGLSFGDVTFGQEEELVWTMVLIDTSEVAQALKALSQPAR